MPPWVGTPTPEVFYYRRAKTKNVTDMTTKTYISPTVLSIRTNDGTRVTFEELSEGRGGIFTTSNDRIQREIEAHPLYGKRFRLKETVSAQAAAQAAEEKKSRRS